MKMILHILAKDLRRHRWELMLFVLACAAWAWQTAEPFGLLWIRTREFAPILFLGLWFIVTVRVVQGESLVGDREFWMTRPYRWGRLIAAKALLLLLCLNLPLLIAQVILLHSAGIGLSWPLLPGLFFLQAEFAFFLTFPAAALAAVTESLVQWGLALAGILVFALMLSSLPWDKLPPGLEGGENICSVLGMAIIAPALAFVLAWQYARRRVWPARLVFAGALLVIPLIILLSSTPLIRSIAYPHPSAPAPFQLAIAENGEDPGRIYKRSENIAPGADISIPVIASPADPDASIDVDGFRVTLTGDNGWRWQSPWLNRSLKFSKDDPRGSIFFAMPEESANQMAHLHARASVEIAFGVYRLGPPHKVDTQADHFSLTSDAVCHWFHGTSDRFSFNGVDCAAPLHLPEIMEVRIDSATSTCPESPGEPPLPTGHSAAAAEHGTDLPDFDPDPVHKINLNFGAWIPPIPSAGAPDQNLQAKLCRGTPLTVRVGTLEGRRRATFDLGSIGTEKAIQEDPDGTIRF
jgi:hypothetical protein